MANRTELCRTCGKPFIPCAKGVKEIGAFNYMEVCCSYECGQIYLKRVTEGRKKQQSPTSSKKDYSFKTKVKDRTSYDKKNKDIEDTAKDNKETETKE